jgi:RNA polymerase sigma factor (sigma-70 family)
MSTTLRTYANLAAAAGTPASRSLPNGPAPVEPPAVARLRSPEAETTDAVLLRRFVGEQDATAFAAIVTRYERLVMGVALRQVGDKHRAEDVFQATFLVLAEQAGRIRKPEALACWLHGTARRLGLKALADVRRTRTMQDAATEPAVDVSPLAHLQEAYERQALDAELTNLPEHLRLPLVLHYLEGLTGREVASRLELSVDTVEGRLKQGRNRLRERLVRHGIGLGAATAALQLSQEACLAASGGLAETTTAASLAWVNHQSLGACSANAARLAAQELAAMTATKATVVASLAAALCLGTGAVGGLALGDATGSGGGRPAATISQAAGSLGGAPGGIAAFDAASTSETGSGLVVTTNLPDATPASAGLTIVSDGREVVVKGDSTTELRAAGLEFRDVPIRSPGKTNYARVPQSREGVESVLDGPAQPLDFQETPLSDVTQFLSEAFSVPVILDEMSLADAGYAVDATVSIKTPPTLTGREAVEAILEQLGTAEQLDYVIRNGRLLVTTREKADEMLETVVYEVRDLEPNMRSDEVMELVQLGTSGVWIDEGGPGSLASMPGGLVVRASQRVHREVSDLLEQLRQFSTSVPTASLGAPLSSDPSMMSGGMPGLAPVSGNSSPASRIKRPLSAGTSGGGGGFGGGMGGGGLGGYTDGGAGGSN